MSNIYDDFKNEIGRNIVNIRKLSKQFVSVPNDTDSIAIITGSINTCITNIREAVLDFTDNMYKRDLEMYQLRSQYENLLDENKKLKSEIKALNSDFISGD